MATFQSPKIKALLGALARDPAAPVSVGPQSFSFTGPDGLPWPVEIRDAQALCEYLMESVVEEREVARQEGHKRGYKAGFRGGWGKKKDLTRMGSLTTE